MLPSPASNPASSYEQAVARVRAYENFDDDSIAPYARTILFDHGERRPYAIVLLHGLTNNPNQYRALAPKLHDLGANVFVPRMPFHGEANRLTKSIASLTAEMLIAGTNEALDIACGLGEHIVVAGISMGGLLAAYFGQHRAGVYAAIPIAPEFSVLQLPYEITQALGAIVHLLPNFFIWWNPRLRDAQEPKTAYPWFSTHALAQTLRIARDVYVASHRSQPEADRIANVVNRTDPAVSNRVTLEVTNAWRRLRPRGIEYVELQHLPENHDIIDPGNPLARTDLVYPRLIDVILGKSAE